MMYTVDEIGEDFVVVNGERLEVDPPFEILPDKQDYENWLNEVMTDAVKAIGSRQAQGKLRCRGRIRFD